MTETTTVTVLFTDVVGSTSLRQHQGETAAQVIMNAHNETSVASPAQPDPRMFLCPTPSAAAGFWNDLIAIVDRGAHTSQSRASQVAEQHWCWLETHETRPVAMQAGTMRIGDGGANDGYVTPDYYVYVQFLNYGLRR